MAVLFSLILVFSACRAKKKIEPLPVGPAAEVRQTVPAPTLAPSPLTGPPPGQGLIDETPQAPPPSPPKGPQTILPGAVIEAAPLPAPAPPLPRLAPPSAVPAPVETPPALVSEPQKEPEQVSFAPKLVKAETDIDIILDASGSMAAPLGLSPNSKFDVMKAAVLDTLIELQKGQADYPRNIAVRVFGSKSPIDEMNRMDTELVSQMASPDVDAVKKALGKIQPKGLSPLANTLEETKKDFPPGSVADRLIVLVADGGDNTEGDPCEAVKKMREAGEKFQLQMIAFDINPTDQEKLECITKNADGKFYLARNENELKSFLDQAINSTVPYNLHLSVQAGSFPIPFELTVLRAGTSEIIKKDKGFGTKFLNLKPGSYDLKVDYAESPERQKPSKILKGVEITTTTKVEQTLNFDLGQLILSATGTDGIPAGAGFDIYKTGAPETVATAKTEAGPINVFITPGIYDITADIEGGGPEAFTLSERGIEVKSGASAEGAFRFQKGTLLLTGVTTQKQALPFIFQAYRAGQAPEELVASGALPAEGGAVNLVPGTYDLILIGQDPQMSANPRTKVTSVEVRAAETSELAAVFEMGTMKLSAVDGQGGKLQAEFIVNDHDTQMEMAIARSENGEPTQVSVPPGNYDIVAKSLKSKLEPRPSVPVTGVAVIADKPVEQVIKFVLGTLRLRGRSAKEQAIQTQLAVYKAGTDEKVSEAPASSDWVIFDIAPGTYDAFAVNMSSTEKPPPSIWLRDLKVEDGKSTSHEAIYTAGKLKIIGRGPNNQIIKCHFKVFQYGADRELINGETGEDWEVFELEPGKYYLEAAYHDDAQSVMLKKWINITVGENEVVEEVLRF